MAPKSYTLDEVREHNNGKSCWLVIHDKVYDVSGFLDEHPGGEEVLLELAGDHATEQFEDVGHSEDARELLKDYEIGDLAEKDRVPFSQPKTGLVTETTSSGIPVYMVAAAIIGFGLSALAYVVLQR